MSRHPTHRTPVVNPSAPLFSSETYTEKILKLPIGMKLGRVLVVTTHLPTLGVGSSGAARHHRCSDGESTQLVRGLFSHVPAATTLSAAHRAAAAISAAAASRARRDFLFAKEKRFDASAAAAAAPSPVVVESDSEGTSSQTDDDASDIAKPMCTRAELPAAVVDSEDDWETAALLEEAAQLQYTPLPTSTSSLASRTTATMAERRKTAPLQPRKASSDVVATQSSSIANPLPETKHLPSTTTTTPSSTSSETLLHEVQYASQLAATYAVLDDVAAVLPPPSAWWLRRPHTAAVTDAVVHLPLYVHCVEATKQWVEWVDALQRPPSPDNRSVHHNDHHCCSSPPLHNTVDLRGVSLAGWSSAYVPDALDELGEAQLHGTPGAALTFRIEATLPRTLPLRGLHLESTINAVTTLLWAGGAAAAWHDSLVALDLPYLRASDAGTQGCQHTCGGDEAAQSFSRALDTLRQLRFCSLNHNSVAWTGLVSSSGSDCAGDTTRNVRADDALCHLQSAAEAPKPLAELLLLGATNLSARALASTGRRCVFLRVVDFSSTAITEAELSALVFGTSDDTAVILHTRRDALLPWLEELRLAACHALTRVRALAGLPRLRLLNLQASGVCQLNDLVGCDALEEVVLTRCASVTQLYPLWRLPRLRCVEADNMRSLQLLGGLLPPPAPPPPALSHRAGLAKAAHATDVDMDDATFAAPLRRLNLSQAAVLRGTAVARLTTALHNVSGRLHSLTVLLLDQTSIDDSTVEALAGVFASVDETGGGGVTAMVATGLRELSLVGCLGVHHLGPLGLLPQLTHLAADGAGVEHVDGLQRSHTLSSLSLAHCTRLWSIAPLAYVASLRSLDVSRTPLNDAGLLRFVFPGLVDELIARQLHGGDVLDTAAVAAMSSSMTTNVAVVPSQVRALRLYQCTSLRYIGCVAHLPRLRRLDVSYTVVFDRGFVGFFACPAVLLWTQLWTASSASAVAAAAPAVSWADEEEGRGEVRREADMAVAPVPDEIALLRAWRRWPSLQPSSADAVAHRDASREAAVAPGERHDAAAAAVEAERSDGSEFVFYTGAAGSLAHVSFAYCAEVRGITPCALFTLLTSLDLTGTAVDSAALLTFVNVLHECCDVGDAVDDVHMTLEMEKGGLRAAARYDAARGDRADKGADAAARRVRRRSYTLSSLTLSFCHYVTDVRCCATIPSLRHLILCGTPIDNTSIEALAAAPAHSHSASPNSRMTARWWRLHQCALHSLDIRYCRRVTDVTPLLLLQTPATDSGDLVSAPTSSALQELLVSYSGVMASKAELQALNPHSTCVLTM
jgi:hypothetical protein